MITFHNTKVFNSNDFEEYKKIKGYSHSYLKQEIGGIAPDFNVTDAVRFGSMVDNILTEPTHADITSQIYEDAKEVARLVVSFFGFEFWEECKSQLGFTTEMEYKGLVMPFKGRLDKFSERSKMVIDLKITNSRVKDLDTLIDYMGYKNQLWGYSKGVEAERALLIFFSRKDKKAVVKPINVSENSNVFFEEKILMYGN
jgi:hypothetical protein